MAFDGEVARRSGSSVAAAVQLLSTPDQAIGYVLAKAGVGATTNEHKETRGCWPVWCSTASWSPATRSPAGATCASRARVRAASNC